MKIMHAIGLMAGIALGNAVTDAPAQDYPVKPVRMVIPFPPGGGADLMGRLIAPRLSERLGHQVVIDNRGGAGGNIGTELAAKSPPDGYTLLLGVAALAINVSLYKSLPFDPLKDLVPVCLVASTPNIVTTHPSLPARSMKELIALARARPGAINYASGGNGTTLHLAAELLKTMARIDIVHVPYKGTVGAVVAALSGEVSVIIPPAAAVLPHARSGKLNALAITSAQRSAAVPDLPTVAEAALPGFEAGQWYGVLVPAGSPAPITQRLGKELMQIMRSDEMRSKLEADATIPIGSTSQEFAAYLRSEIDKWSKVVKISGARVD